MKRIEVICIKMMLYVIFFGIAIKCQDLVAWFCKMPNMTLAMILMSVVMLVDKGWDLIHAK